MSDSTLVVSLPIADRPRSFRFYRDWIGLEAVGEVAEDGVPEPLQFVVNDGVRLVLVPTGGFGWVLGGRDVASPGVSECVLSLSAASEPGVDELVERGRQAGATVVTEPGQQPWGYAGAIADPDGHVWMITAATAAS